jgi:hypothetical protein
MADPASAIHNKLFHCDWKEWDSYTNKDFRKLQRRKVKRKFDRVSREEIEAGIDEGEMDGYGKYDESDLMERDMFFD